MKVKTMADWNYTLAVTLIDSDINVTESRIRWGSIHPLRRQAVADESLASDGAGRGRIHNDASRRSKPSTTNRLVDYAMR